jgi:hypothetical protein
MNKKRVRTSDMECDDNTQKKKRVDDGHKFTIPGDNIFLDPVMITLLTNIISKYDQSINDLRRDFQCDINELIQSFARTYSSTYIS